MTTTNNPVSERDLAGEPLALPRCAYPTAAEIDRHGVQALPPSLPVADLDRVRPYRSRRHLALPASALTPAQVLETAGVVADAFSRREPQCRHLRPPCSPPAALAGRRHEDPLGSEEFGPWTNARLLYWFIRLLILTDPTSPRVAIRVNDEVLQQSLVVAGRDGRILGGAINETLQPHDEPLVLRANDPFLEAVLAFAAPIIELLQTQDAEAVAALERYPDFRASLSAGKVGHHFMIARSDELAKGDTFELIAATAERYRALGFRYFLVEATNQWTGAACEALSGVRVHFVPFRARRVVPASPEPVHARASSIDGYVAAKDSGSMLYVIRVA
jgi:hypothetical protein